MPQAVSPGLLRSAYALRQDDVLGRRVELRAAAAAPGARLPGPRRRGRDRLAAEAAPARLAAHAAGLACAAAGFCVFALANRRFYGVWGGVAGWYLWGWSPWLAVAADDLGSIGPRAARPLLVAEAAFVVVANAVWLSAHGRLVRLVIP